MKYYDFSNEGKNLDIDPSTNTILLVFDENRTENRTCLYEIDTIHGEFSAKKINGIPVRNDGTLRMSFPINLVSPAFSIGEDAYYIDSLSFKSLSVVVDNPIIPRPLYNDHGMYYVYETDVSKFNQNLSQNLYMFYDNVTRAESDRQYIQELLNSKPNAELEGQYFDAYMDMRTCIIYAAKMAPKILDELKNEKAS